MNKKISQLDALGTAPAGTDILPITDVSGTPTTKSVTVANLHSGLQAEPTEGAFVNGDKTKLDGIEASADVTDATNVTAAGALMDSEVTNLAQVKAFDSADYATASQGALADSATQPSDLGTAAAKDVGTSNGNVVELDATGLPAVDGSQLTNLPSPSLSIVSEATTARTLSNSDNGKVIVCSNSSSVTITLPTGLTSGFSCTVVQNGTGTVKVEGGAAISAINNINATVGQYGHLNIIPIGSDAYLMEGEGQRLFGNVNSLSFDGVNDELNSSGNVPLGSNGEFSVVAWFKTTDVDGGKETILDFGTGAYFHIRTTAANTEIREGSAGQSLGSHSTTNWNYVAVYHDGTNLKGSLNGAAFVAKTRENTYTESAAQDPIKIGNNNFSQYFPGLIDEVAWWDSAVSESDLLNIYNSGVPINLTSYSPNHWWRMGDSDGGTGSIVSDEIGSNNLTITGATSSSDVP